MDTSPGGSEPERQDVPHRASDAFAYGPDAPPEAGPAEPKGATPPGGEPGGEEVSAEEKPRGRLHFFRELPGLIIIALVLALLIKTFLVQAFFIPSESMEPTLDVGDRVLVNKIGLRFREPRRGEVIVFENPNHEQPDRNPFSAVLHWFTEGLGISSDPQKDFIKRVIGLPGETIEIKGGKVFIDGERLREPYLQGHADKSNMAPLKIPEGHYFFMGDNRANSQDSRFFGPVPRDNVVGQAFVILWPPSRFAWLSGD